MEASIVDWTYVSVEPRPRSQAWAILALAGFCLAALAWTPGAAHADLELGVYEGVPWPIVPPPISGPLPPAPRHAGPPPPAATRGGERILAELRSIRETMTETRYQHASVVRPRDGVYRWDCSGMAAWILRRATPRAMGVISRERPVARDFAAAIERAPVGRARSGWERVERLELALPGDVFSWRRPRGFPSHNTGHVGFVVDRPLPVAGMPGAYAVRVTDSTTWGHQDDTRPDDGVGGFGTGTLVFLTDASGQGSHYGWFGTRSEGYVVTPIFIGRVHR